jgi:hypothetical protein
MDDVALDLARVEANFLPLVLVAFECWWRCRGGEADVQGNDQAAAALVHLCYQRCRGCAVPKACTMMYPHESRTAPLLLLLPRFNSKDW